MVVALGDKIGIALMKQLNADEMRAVSDAITKLDSLTPSETETVLEEFCQLAGQSVGRDAFECAKRVLAKTFGPEGSAKETLQSEAPGFSLADEHPQTIALMLSHVDAAQAATLLAKLPLLLGSDVTLRIAQLDRVSPDVIARMSAGIGQKLAMLGQVKTEMSGGPRAVAEILKRIDSKKLREEILGGFGEEQPLVEAIRHFMFSFEDLVFVDTATLKKVVAQVDRKVLVLALKGASDPTQVQFLRCLATRGAQILRRQIESAGPARIRDVESAQQQILQETLRQLESKGVFSLGGGGGSQYVV